MIRTLVFASVTSAFLLGTAGTTAASETITYEYDAQGRLVKVVHAGTVNNGETVVYTHDDADNRVKKTTTGA